MSGSTQGTEVGRRAMLALTGSAILGGAVATSGRAAAAAEAPVDLEAWFANTDNFEGVVDRTGAETVTVEVGAQGNGGPFGFGPAAVRVDPGATVVWEWTGEGGVHNVTASDGSFGSDLLGDAGATFEHAFDAEGVWTYVCEPHAAMGMKGAIVVGNAATGPDLPEPDYGDWFANTDNFDGTVDRTGRSEVRIAVGAAGNGGSYAFEPAAVRVDPGTTVVWEWTGQGGSHDVTDANGEYRSDLQSAEGATYALTFDGDGISKYACTPHEAMGMKGAVVVGDVAARTYTIGAKEGLVGGSLLLALVSPALFGVALSALGRDGDGPAGGDATTGARPGDGVAVRGSARDALTTDAADTLAGEDDDVDPAVAD